MPLLRTASMVFAVIVVGGSVAFGQTIQAKVLTPVKCTKCLNEHGDFIVTYSDGKKQTLSKYGMATQPRVASDLRTVGWVGTEHVDRSKVGSGSGVYALASALLIYRDGKQVRAIAPGNPVVRDWGFRNGNKQVAIHSSPLQQGEAFTLVDIATGKTVATYGTGDGHAPDWTLGLK